MNFDRHYFQKMTFTAKQVRQYLDSAERDAHIAQTSDITEVQFAFAYQALIKAGITIIASSGYKVRSQPGHHIKIVDALSQILGDQNVAIMGDAMRQSRNLDLYDGGTVIAESESREYVKFVAGVLKRVQELIK